MEEQVVYRRRADVRFRTVLDEGVVVRSEAAEILVLNGVGTRILELVDGERTMQEIAGALYAEFEVEESELRLDLESFVRELDDAGILERVVSKAEGPGP
jgi:hypothetical protein